MFDFICKKATIYTLILISLIINSSCRTTVKEPLRESTLNNFNQIGTFNRGEPDDRGIITFDTYQVLIANGTETISEIAIRLEIDEEKLALYNGLIPNYRPRAKEMIALPDDVFIGSSGWSKEITKEKIKQPSSQEERKAPTNDPLRHRVKEGETVYSLAREYNVSVNSIATWNGLGPELDIKTGREIIIPTAEKTTLTKKTSKETHDEKLAQKELVNTNENEQLKTTNEKENVFDQEIVSESQVSTPPKAKIVSIRPLIAPVEGQIISQYNQSKGSQNNNGIDYETSVGSPVKAVSLGTVVLISDIVGGNGKIILIRHDDELITIYGRLTNIVIEKGQKVIQGQKIGEVIKDSETDKGIMHFEVRKGMKSIDPETMIR